MRPYTTKYEALSYQSMRPSATSVFVLKLPVYCSVARASARSLAYAVAYDVACGSVWCSIRSRIPARVLDCSVAPAHARWPASSREPAPYT
jgi:hypothetical protein